MYCAELNGLVQCKEIDFGDDAEDEALGSRRVIGDGRVLGWSRLSCLR